MPKFVDKFVLAIKTDDVTGGIRDVDRAVYRRLMCKWVNQTL